MMNTIAMLCNVKLDVENNDVKKSTIKLLQKEKKEHIGYVRTC